ncbi:MAG: MFS transporter [Propionibacteriaceae bacterium]|nr:MFS transporter [Propionibacteriaceae bacterium]
MDLRPWHRLAAALTAVGWGANQFAPMLLAYRIERGLTEQVVTGLLAVYVGGLIPALLLAAWWSQHHGKRPMMRISVVLMLVASLLLLAGADSPALLLAGRVVGGIGVGFAMGPGTAWMKELSSDAPAGTGARRASLALTLGFALGPIVSGVSAQWLPQPLHLPYVLHLLAQVLAAAWVWNVVEADAGDHPIPSVRAVVAHVLQRWFVSVVVPAAPWVFGCATVAFAVVPSVTGPLPGLPRIAAAGATAGLTLGTSVFLQPFMKRLASDHPQRVVAAGMGVGTLGMGIATAAAVWPAWWWLPIVAVVLGCAHGLVLVGSMTEVELNTPHHLMAPATAVVYCLTYIGFLVPFAIAVVATVAPTWAVLAAGAGVALVTTVWLVVNGRRPVLGG